MRKKSLLTGAALAACLATSGVPALAGKSDDTLTVAFAKQLENLDAYSATAREMIVIARHVWDGLLYRDPATGEYLGNLAESFEWVDATTIDFVLREGVTFHNGEAFDADDAVYTLNWVSKPENGVSNQGNVNWIASAEKTGPYSLRLHLKEPFPAALEYLSGPVVMYPNEYHAEVGTAGMGSNPVGTGPYKVTSVEAGKRYVFEKNDGYFAGPKGTAEIGKIVWRTIPERNTQFAELLSGGVDWVWQVPPDQAEKLGKKFSVSNESTMRIGYVSFDSAGRTGETPMSDIRVRKAIAHAINREAIVNALLKGASKVVHSACFPSQFGCFQDVAKYDYDPARAKELLAEAGYPDGFTVPFFAYRDRGYAEAIIGDLAAVGISVDFGYLKYAALRDKVQGGEVPFQFMTWGSNSVNDVSAITSHFFSHGKDDYALDADVKTWLTTADTSIDPAVRKENYAKALSKIADEVYWLPLFSYNVNYVYSDELEFTPYPDEVPRFFQARWK
ncbi:ABC transporter substrate-binding protein [Primorskyibacter aestuariivivens]|uniref:ABC transporter substrate-binding protein n=1 Tax=Primorskyibacter aestuariivivens TaxID=1888912 RepID=UPI0022FFD920|nr:ABC transporter substrate-binding protein [Primorskyibacter aestuariivivens]MDA7430906.1 ABC transporter substrate-binding protein [Primorskyibacter aestuariivivens]